MTKGREVDFWELGEVVALRLGEIAQRTWSLPELESLFETSFGEAQS